MTIGKPLRCYPFKKKDGTYIYLPYDKTEFDLTFIGDDADMKPIQEYWESINKLRLNCNKKKAIPNVYLEKKIGTMTYLFRKG